MDQRNNIIIKGLLRVSLNLLSQERTAHIQRPTMNSRFYVDCHSGKYYVVDRIADYCDARHTHAMSYHSLSEKLFWTSKKIFNDAMRILTGTAPGDMAPDFSLDEIAYANDMISALEKRATDCKSSNDGMHAVVGPMGLGVTCNLQSSVLREGPL